MTVNNKAAIAPAILLSLLIHSVFIFIAQPDNWISQANNYQAAEIVQLNIEIHRIQGVPAQTTTTSQLLQKKMTPSNPSESTRTSAKSDKIVTTLHKNPGFRINSPTRQAVKQAKTVIKQKQSARKHNLEPRKNHTASNPRNSHQKGDTRPPQYGLGSPLNPKPDYPYRAQKLGLQGKVILQLSINKKGKVDRIKIKQSTGYKILDNAASQTLSKWIFKPALINGKTVNSVQNIPIIFKLNN